MTKAKIKKEEKETATATATSVPVEKKMTKVHFVMEELAEKRWRANDFGFLSPVAIGATLGNMVAKGEVQPNEPCQDCGEDRVHVNVDDALLTKVAETHKEYLASKPIHPDKARKAIDVLEHRIASYSKGCPRMDVSRFALAMSTNRKGLVEATFAITTKEQDNFDARQFYNTAMDTLAELETATVNELTANCKDLLADNKLSKEYGQQTKISAEELVAKAMTVDKADKRISELFTVRSKLKNELGLRYPDQRFEGGSRKPGKSFRGRNGGSRNESRWR